MIIERRWIGNYPAYAREWRFYSEHRHWTLERAQQSVDRLNRNAPRSWQYRVAPQEEKRG